jgi:hypothetical protein
MPALLVMAWLVAGLPLLLLGWFTPAAMLAASVAAAAGLLTLGLRWTPDRWAAALPAPAPGRAGTPWWAIAALVAVAVAFGVDQAVYHSQQIIVERDPAAYMQFGNWIARHGSLPIPADRAAFGPAGRLLRFDSSAFYQVGGTVVPQFMAGLPLLLAGGFWAGGVSAAVLVAPVLGACGVLTFGGLAARLIGPRWAPLAALALALSLPEQFTSRSAYSEPAAQILFLGGLCLVIDALGTGGAARRAVAGLGGLALGLTVLVRVDGASDILPLIPYAGLLLAMRRREAIPLAGGALAGLAYGALDGLLLSRPYLSSIEGSLVPLAALTGAAVAGTAAAAVALRRRGRLLRLARAWLPGAAAAAVVLVMAGFAIRPYVQTVHGQVTALARRVVAGYQRTNGLPVDPTRLYYEISLHWVFWYIGVPAVVLGTLGAALLARRCASGAAAAWALPLLTLAWVTVATLARPGITPDQPWASRRLVPGVLPGFLLLAVWAAAWLSARLVPWRRGGLAGRRLAWLRGPGAARAARWGTAAACAAALLAPPAVTTFGLAAGGAGGMATVTTYGGEVAAVDGLCAALPASASVVIISFGTASRLTQTVRGMCGVPVARLPGAGPAAIAATLRGIRAAGRRPVLLAAGKAQLTRYGGAVRQVMRLRSRSDPHTLTRPPAGTSPLRLNVWMWLPRR